MVAYNLDLEVVLNGGVTMDMMKAIGTRIREAREAKHLTQEQLAEMVGVSPTHMSVIERGVKGPRLRTFIAIANALDTTSDSLLLDVLNNSVQIEVTELSRQIGKLSPKEQQKILKIVSVLVEDD